MGRTRQQALDTRAKIIDAAERAFFLRGATRTSLDDIAKEAGVTRGAVYGHFKNKEAVFHAMFECSNLPLDPLAVTACHGDGDPLSQLRADLRRRLLDGLQIARARRLYTITFNKCESAPETADFCERIQMAALRAEAQIEVALRCAVARGQLCASIDTRQAANFIHAALSGFFRKRLMMPSPANADAEVDHIVATAFRCIDHASPAARCS
ncbi:TetR/AcrR family acrAB operon transcriptional repressor [Paraburkholderia phenoliruptrix]|uniref:TetR family transcriptional regulator n=1 Tax=Paraburkholderia phenoliruptrix TaxID=252970 RepID=UPI00285BB3CF|nr:TetR family transcriptional regulator [Paraburkholderia phenoliruptrix]MDR6422614.1 TetR/AcrR family acrAB operon transcriptional repressor [Paraburkholderia phenoliruptrix]